MVAENCQWRFDNYLVISSKKYIPKKRFSLIEKFQTFSKEEMKMKREVY